MRNRFKIVEDDFMIQSCYTKDDVIVFNIGFKHKKIWIYESGCYYDFDNVFVFDNSEMIRANRDLVQYKIESYKNYIILELKELLN